jgi:excisionase family DNA binding protein
MNDELSPSQVAARIGATTRSVQRWIANGSLPARRVGGRWRVASDVLDAFTRGGEPAGPGELGRNGPPGPLSGQLEDRAGNAIRSLFVANRGEIATRIRHTADRLGIVTLVPGEGATPPVDLLDIDAVVGAARAGGADAIHPGYGFLAENAGFADAVLAAGIRWVGPPPAALRAMGDKAAARRLAASLDVPILPGYDDADQSDAAFAVAAARIGAPLVIKPAAGGGGKGMRVVRDLAALPDALASARREALTAFGDDRLILERYLQGPRHIEVQLLFDGSGAGVHLGARDCSLQRRHQKVLEESPAPTLAPEVRARMAKAALRLGAEVGYTGAGTCEFLVDDRSGFFFLEMNTRLQVEHPVTEAVTGRDLVADQLAIAAGASLAEIGADQTAIDAALASGGHAIEVRLYAEDADDGFLPATGRIVALGWPVAARRFEPSGVGGVRIDSGIALGTAVGPRFDPLLAKVIAHGHDRAQALDGLARALDEASVLGLTTNLRFLRWLVREPVVRAGEARIDTLERIWPPDDWSKRTAMPPEAWSAAAGALLAGLRSAEPLAPDPFGLGWRINGEPLVRIAIEGQERAVRPTRFGPSTEFAIAGDGDAIHLDLGGRSVEFRLAPPPDVDRAARAAVAHGQGAVPSAIVAPMPGSVLAVHVALGDAVETGQPIMTLEAMKMEHAVLAPGPGRVSELLVAVADQVTRGQALATIEPTAVP